MSSDCAELYGDPADTSPYLNSALFVSKLPVSLPTVSPADPVSLVIWISASPDFLTWISFTGASVVPTPIFKANDVEDAPTNPASILWLNVAIPDTIKFDIVDTPRLYLSVPVPTTPNKSLFTSSYQFIAWAKYPLPVLWTWANIPW